MKQQILVLIFLVLISGTLGQTQGGDCPGGYFQVSRTACFIHSQCPDRSFCWFTPTRTHGICCPYCQTPRGGCPGGHLPVSRTACFSLNQCPENAYCWFPPSRTYGICCPYCEF